MKAFDYIKTAFMNHWHLVALVGSTMFAVISPVPDAAIALIIAAEIGYLTLLGTNPKFRLAVDAQVAKANRLSAANAAQQTFERILHALPRSVFSKFEDLRKQCVDLQQLAGDIGQKNDNWSSNYRIEGLDRLLWIYIKLLYTQFAIGKFLSNTNSAQIINDISKTQKKLEVLPTDASDRLRKALTDNLKTCNDRLANIKRATDNAEAISLEIESLENKIKALGEMAVSQEPAYISGQVDEVVSGMMDTEKTMSDLNFMTGLEANDDAPQLLNVENAKAKAKLKLVS